MLFPILVALTATLAVLLVIAMRRPGFRLPALWLGAGTTGIAGTALVAWPASSFAAGLGWPIVLLIVQAVCLLLAAAWGVRQWHAWSSRRLERLFAGVAAGLVATAALATGVAGIVEFRGFGWFAFMSRTDLVTAALQAGAVGVACVVGWLLVLDALLIRDRRGSAAWLVRGGMAALVAGEAVMPAAMLLSVAGVVSAYAMIVGGTAAAVIGAVRLIAAGHAGPEPATA